MVTIAHSLRILQHWFDEVASGRAEFTAEGCATFSQTLGAVADSAEEMEATAATLAGSLEHYDAVMRGVGGAMLPAPPNDCQGERRAARDVVVPFRRPRAPSHLATDDGSAA